MAIHKFKKQLLKEGEIVVTLPIGYNTYLDKLLKEDKDNSRNPKLLTQHFFFFTKRKLNPYRVFGVVGQSPTVLKEKHQEYFSQGFYRR